MGVIRLFKCEFGGVEDRLQSTRIDDSCQLVKAPVATFKNLVGFGIVRDAWSIG